MEILPISIGVVFLGVAFWTVILQITRIKKADKITFIKEGKSVTVSSIPSKEDRIKLLNF